MVNQRRSTRRNYDRASTCDDDSDTNDEDRPTSSASKLQTTNEANDDDTIQIQILDSAQNKFTIPSVSPSTWTVRQLKDIGGAKHAVPPPQQRLIYMGKLLNDDTAFLSHYGIEKDLSIIHLFPKPIVVIDRGGGGNREDTSLCSSSNNNDNSANDNETAHIPQIILDASEAERHSSVIILSSHEAFEILHRVRLCAFCLLVYSSMELLQDLTLWMGKSFHENDGRDCDYDEDDNCMEYKPDEPTDTTAPSPYGDDGYGVWESWNYIDVLISLYAFYVAMLGIKVTTEHERKTARLFWILLLVLAFTWNGFYYWNLVREIKEERDKAKGGGFNDDDDLNGQDSIDPTLGDMSPYNLALWYMSFLFLLWFVFLFWARQFKNLMEEAGAEADDRTRNLTNGNALNEAGYGGADSGGVENNEGRPDTTSGNNYDLELQVEGRTIT